MDWVLIIFGTQVIKKKRPVRPVFPDYLSVSYDYDKIKEGNIDALKAAKLFLENSSISKDIVVLFDEMYLQKCVEYCGGEFFG